MSDNAYSRFVSWAKVLFPLAALALLSTLFLFARGNGTGDIPYADIEALANEPRLSSPNVAGVTKDGATFDVSAEVARPDPETAGALIIERINFDLSTDTGTGIDISAGLGQIDTEAHIIRLEKLARVETSDGYLMETPGLVADVRSGIVTSTGQLEIRAPFGELTAGSLTVTTTGNTAQMDFKDGVRLVYRPQE